MGASILAELFYEKCSVSSFVLTQQKMCRLICNHNEHIQLLFFDLLKKYNQVSLNVIW